MERADKELPHLTEFIFNLTTGLATMNRLDFALEFPVTNPATATKPCRYVYCG